jgi:hypothetical protein
VEEPWLVIGLNNLPNYLKPVVVENDSDDEVDWVDGRLLL